MSIHAGANIAMALERFHNRGYAKLGGFILNRRNVQEKKKKVQELAEDFHSGTIGYLSRSELVMSAEEQKKTLMECYPDSEMADEYRALSEAVLAICKN